MLDLFCGAAGGWSLGLHRAGFQTVAACEIDPARRAAFSHNNPCVRMYDDIRNLSAARLRRDLGFLPEVIAGSPPCQDASTANPNGKGIKGERTGLFTEYVRLVREINPRWVAAENVPGFRTRGADWVLDALEALGYACWPLVVGAEHAGAPHERKRVWFIARDTNEARLAQRQGQRGHAQPQFAPPQRAGVQAFDADEDQRRSSASDQEIARHVAALERATGTRRIQFNHGPARHLRVADGVPPRLARQCIAAYGDSVVPQITEALGNAIRRTELMLAEVA